MIIDKKKLFVIHLTTARWRAKSISTDCAGRLHVIEAEHHLHVYVKQL